ncbi:MAG: hypothetical protein Q7U78_05450 [Gallionella sp.]|nr:hypothetical protein [Gallionella sp.]
MARLLISSSPSLPGRIIGLIVTAALIVLGLMFSMVLIALIAVVGLIAGGYLWWKTRTLRKQMREHQQSMRGAANDADAFKGEVFEGEIIEGEVICKVVSLEENRR